MISQRLQRRVSQPPPDGKCFFSHELAVFYPARPTVILGNVTQQTGQQLLRLDSWGSGDSLTDHGQSHFKEPNRFAIHTRQPAKALQALQTLVEQGQVALLDAPAP